ncbi:MAG: AAA family ATPase, partial [Caldilineaceae bacterium]
MLLATKLFTPQPHRQMVTRPRLLQAINNGLSGRVILICAPAGSGKTTLIADWLAQQQGRRQSVWLALDEQDNDPVRFLTYLLAAFQRVEATLGAGLQAMLQMAQPPSPEHLLTQLLNELAACPATMALVLDDYHVITTPAIHDLLHFFVDHLSPNVVLVIASRSEPPLPLARWRVRRLLVEVRERALRFTQAETTAFLHQELDTQLAAEDIVALVERTEGWIAGLQLAVLSLQGRQEIAPFLHSFTGSHHYTMDYLTEEVLQRLPRTVEAFLLQTSILARLTASLCDAVTGTTEAQSILLQLERANLFLIPLDQERQWYRYHHLFADVLRKTLAGSYAPPMVAELHQRAGDWFEQHGFISEAVDHALASGDLQRAAVRIESASEDLLNHGQHLTLQRWLQKLPPDTLQTRPRLLLVSAAIASHMHLLAESERALHAAEAAAATLAPGARALLLAEIAVSQASMALNRSDYQQVCRLAQQALATLPEHDQRARGEALFYLGTACALQGNIVQAEQAYARAVPLSKAAGDLRTAILAMSNQSR